MFLLEANRRPDQTQRCSGTRAETRNPWGIIRLQAGLLTLYPIDPQSFQVGVGGAEELEASDAVEDPRAHDSTDVNALGIWNESLQFLQQQEANANDAVKKVAFAQQIEAFMQKIAEWGGGP